MSSLHENSSAYADELDRQDPLRHFRDRFIIPVRHGQEQIYFLGNSLGLQPKAAAVEINRVLEQWSAYGVEGFFDGDEPWMKFHDQLRGPLSAIVGALPSEVVVMNQLTVNLHLMMVSFYRPAGRRRKILCEAKAFPSDQYMLETHLKFLGLDPNEIIIEVFPESGSDLIEDAAILAAIEHHRDELALIFWGGINYYSGQVFDMKAITIAAHAVGAMVGFDLAHAAGNVPLRLHEWDTDFACWCSYKYLNSGPGAVGGVYIHERFHKGNQVQRLAGWWGYDPAARFKMAKGFEPEENAGGWQLSTPSMLLYASHKAALGLFEEAGLQNVFQKAALLSDYLNHLLAEGIARLPDPDLLEVITPRASSRHGSQVSMLLRKNGKGIFDQLSGAGIFADWREPDVIRIAPVPLYNSFGEVHRFCAQLFDLLRK